MMRQTLRGKKSHIVVSVSLLTEKVTKHFWVTRNVLYKSCQNMILWSWLLLDVKEAAGRGAKFSKMEGYAIEIY